MKLHLIFARARNGVIGAQGTMPWHLPEDLAHLKRTTMGCPVIMGRKTWDSLPPRFRPLPGRTNVVITRQTDWAADGAVSAHSLNQAVELCSPDGDAGDPAASQGSTDAWVLGGAEIYAQAALIANAAVVTEIEADFEGDSMAPVFGPEWVEVSREKHVSAKGLAFSFVNYRNTSRP